jgi:hypothetical protein
VKGELKDVAKGHIIQPLNRLFHCKPMAYNLYRVKISVVLAGYERVEPPYQPKEGETALLENCYKMFLLWPNSHIRLGAAVGTTTQTTPPVDVPTPPDVLLILTCLLHNIRMMMIMTTTSMLTSTSTLVGPMMPMKMPDS